MRQICNGEAEVQNPIHIHYRLEFGDSGYVQELLRLYSAHSELVDSLLFSAIHPVMVGKTSKLRFESQTDKNVH